MLEADRRLKRIVSGLDSLEIKGFTNYWDMVFARAKEDVVNWRPISVPINPLNRFWFCPSKGYFLEKNGILLLKGFGVRLTTERVVLTKRGRRGTGRMDSLAQSFIEDFTARYDQIAQRESIFAELRSLFMLVALAKAMKERDAFSKAGLEPDYWLEEYPLKKYDVPLEVPGVSVVKEFKYARTIPGRKLPDGREVPGVRQTIHL